MSAARAVTLDVTILGRDFKIACKDDERTELSEAVAMDGHGRQVADDLAGSG